jgi:hypothetical protein
MLPFGVTILATVPQRSEILEGLVNYSVHILGNFVKEVILSYGFWKFWFALSVYE